MTRSAAAEPASLASRLLVALAVAAAAVWGVWPALESVHASWTHVYGPFAHGYAILGLAVWLGVHFWRHERPSWSTPSWPAVVLLAVLSAAMATMELLFVNTARQALLPPMLLAALAALAGRGVARTLAWPVLFVYFALPPWWAINAPLQELTARVANGLVAVTGVPAYVSGNRFELPAGIVEVANGCSGLNYLMVALALGLFQGLRYLEQWSNRIRLLAAATVVALLANWLRVYALIVIGYVSDMQHYLIRVDHLYFGWILFLVCMWPVFVYAARLERAERGAGSAPVSGRAPLGGHAPGRGPRALPLLAAGALAAVALVVPRIALAALQDREPGGISALAVEQSGFERVAPTVQWSAASEAAAQDEALAFRIGDGVVDVYRRIFPHESRNAHWNGEAVASFRPSRDMASRTGGTVAGIPVQSRREALQARLRGLLAGRRDAEAWVAVSRCEPTCAAAEARLNAFVDGWRTPASSRSVQPGR